MWCQDNNLSLHVSKTKELIVDYRKRRAEHARIHIDRAVVERVESFKFLGVHITKEVTLSTHTNTVVKKARQHLFLLRRLKIFSMGPQILKRFYRCTIESILIVCIVTWNGNSLESDLKVLQRVVDTAQYITGAELPANRGLYTICCCYCLLSILLPSHFIPSYTYISTSITSYLCTLTQYSYPVYIAKLLLTQYSYPEYIAIVL